MWLTGARDSAEEVRNNAIFGLGEMVLYGKEHVFRLLFISKVKKDLIIGICEAERKTTLCTHSSSCLTHSVKDHLCKRCFVACN